MKRNLNSKYGNFREPILKEIKTASSKRLIDLMQKLDASGHNNSDPRKAIQVELVKRTNNVGGPYKNWGHG